MTQTNKDKYKRFKDRIRKNAVDEFILKICSRQAVENLEDRIKLPREGFTVICSRSLSAEANPIRVFGKEVDFY